MELDLTLLLEKSFRNIETSLTDVENELLPRVHFVRSESINQFPNATIQVYDRAIHASKGAKSAGRPHRRRCWTTSANRFAFGDGIDRLEVVLARGHTKHCVACALEDTLMGLHRRYRQEHPEVVHDGLDSLYEKDTAGGTFERTTTRRDSKHDTLFVTWRPRLDVRHDPTSTSSSPEPPHNHG